MSFIITYFTKFAVSFAIINSSSVGTIQTFTLESFVEISLSTAFTSFAYRSNSTPIHFNCSQIIFLSSGPLSPTPPANAITSTPFNATAYLAIY